VSLKSTEVDCVSSIHLQNMGKKYKLPSPNVHIKRTHSRYKIQNEYYLLQSSVFPQSVHWFDS